MRPPPGLAPDTTGNLTDLRPRKRDRRAEADRHRMTRTPLHRRVIAMMRRAGFEPEAWQVESLATTLTANHEDPTDEQVIRELMAAPWFPKPRRRQWRIGEGGGWRTRS